MERWGCRLGLRGTINEELEGKGGVSLSAFVNMCLHLHRGTKTSIFCPEEAENRLTLTVTSAAAEDALIRAKHPNTQEPHAGRITAPVGDTSQ